MEDLIYLTDMYINFKEDNLWIFVAQHVESWSYSDAGSTSKEAEENLTYNPTFKSPAEMINPSPVLCIIPR